MIVNYNFKTFIVQAIGCKKTFFLSRQDPIKIDSPGMLWSNPNGASALPDNQGSYKTSYIRNLLIFVIRFTVCPVQVFPARSLRQSGTPNRYSTWGVYFLAKRRFGRVLCSHLRVCKTKCGLPANLSSLGLP
jgi:hypothetical protein